MERERERERVRDRDGLARRLFGRPAGPFPADFRLTLGLLRRGGGGERDRETYLAAIDNIVYGEDPSEGFVRGRRFLHPKLGFTFAAPENFTLDNTAQAVIGVPGSAPLPWQVSHSTVAS